MGLVFGLMTGLVEALWLWFNQAVRGRVIFTSDYILWMTPLLYAAVFAALALLVALVAAAVYPRIRLHVAAFIVAALGVLILFIPVTQIARWAAALVALGLAAQVARWARARPDGFRRAWRAALAGTAGLAALIYVGGRLAGRPPPPGELARPDLPNIVLIVWDTVRSENLSLYGYEQPTTPGLERLAGSAVVFDRAISPSPWTLPTHASMFTGRWPHELSTGWLTRLDHAYPTLAEAMAAAGYATGGFVANHHYTSYDSGLARGFHAYGDYRVSWRQFLRSSWLTQTPMVGDLMGARSLGDAWRALRSMNFWVGVKRSNDRKRAHEVNEELLDWLDGAGDRPFFAFLNYFDAHLAYWSPPGYLDRVTTTPGPMRRYDGAIAYLDDQVTALLEALEERGELEETIVIVTSDHGELFGENGLQGHAHNLYYRTIHVPLLIHAPDRFAGGIRVEREVTLRDLAATVMDLAGLEGEAGFPGRSLARFWANAPVGERAAADAGSPGAAASRASGGAGVPRSDSPEPVLAEVEEGRNNAAEEPISRGPMKSVLEDGLHYILNGDGVEELYDYVADPREENDLAGSPEGEAAIARLRAALERFGLGPYAAPPAPAGGGVSP